MIAADNTHGASLAGTFADLLLDAEAASPDVEDQASAMVAPKMPKLAVAEERQDEDVRHPEALEKAPIDVAALAYALVSAIPMDAPVVQEVPTVQQASIVQQTPIVQQVNEADPAAPAVKLEITKAAAVPVGQPSSIISLDLLTPARSEVAAFETEETPVSDTSVSQGSLLQRRDYSQVLSLTAPEFDLREATSSHPEIAGSAPSNDSTAIKMSTLSEPVAVTEAPPKTVPVIVDDSGVRREPLVPAVNDSTASSAPIVLEARIVPKPKQERPSEPLSEPLASPDVVASKDSVTPVQDSVETNLESSEDDHETDAARGSSAERAHTSAIRPDTLIRYGLSVLASFNSPAFRT